MVTEEPLSFPSGALTLEGVLYKPDGPPPRAAVVICHPHPQYGGDMWNLAVMVVVRGLIEAGIASLAFNFRGVGASEGAYDGGAGEQDDVRAALSFARSISGISRVGLAGYSFGAAMAAAVADSVVPTLALVALPPRMAKGPAGALAAYRGRLLLVSGDNDQVSPADEIAAFGKSLVASAEVVIVPGADHSWSGHERPLADAVRDFFKTNL